MAVPETIENFDQLHALPSDYEVYDTEGNVYRRNRDGLWADRNGYFPVASTLARLLPLKPRPISTTPVKGD